MSRTQQQVYDQSVTYYVAQAAAAGITIDPTKWSIFNIQRLIFWSVAGAIAIFEQILDTFTANAESVVSVAAPSTALWIQNFVLNFFQYDATTPQIVLFSADDIAPYYPSVDATKRIVTQCVVVPGALGTTSVKVAKAGPAALDPATELPALQSALDSVTVPGIVINAISNDSDKIYIAGTLTYLGQYSGVIQATAIAAIQGFLAAIPATGAAGVNSSVGLLKLSDLIAAVRAVPGVVDFELNNVNARQDTVAFVPGTYNIVTANTWLQQNYNSGLSGAGYMETESTSSYQITDSITYIAV